MKKDLIIKNMVKLLFPFILIFGLYLQINGDSLPGGGFQAGMVIANGFILYGLANNIMHLQSFLSEKLIDIFSVLGIMIYCLIGVICMVNGGEFLNYYFLFHGNKKINLMQKLGINLVEIGIAITVFSVTLKIFYLFCREGDYDRD